MARLFSSFCCWSLLCVACFCCCDCLCFCVLFPNFCLGSPWRAVQRVTLVSAVPPWKAKSDSIRFEILAGKDASVRRRSCGGWGGGCCELVGAARCGASLFLFRVMEAASNPIRPLLPYQVVECFSPEDFLQLGRGALPCSRHELKHNLFFGVFLPMRK